MTMIQAKQEPSEAPIGHWDYLSASGDRDSGVESAGSAKVFLSPEGNGTTRCAVREWNNNEAELEQYMRQPDEGQERKHSKGTSSASSSSSASGNLSCAVCGDAAFCYHYGVSSCNGCKTFFRRTIISGRKFMCKRGGKCQFDRDGRCACRACRFQRCVNAGMDEKAIQHTPSANLTLSIARKRFQRSRSDTAAHSPLASPSTPLGTGFESEALATIGVALRMEETMNRLRNSEFNPAGLVEHIHEAVELDSVFRDSAKYAFVNEWPFRPPLSPTDGYDQLVKQGTIRFWKHVDLYLGMEYLKTMDFFRAMSRREKILLTKSVIVPNAWLTAAIYAVHIHSDIIQFIASIIPSPTVSRRVHSISLAIKRSKDHELERKILRGAIPALQHLKPDQVQTALIRWILLLNESCDGLTACVRDQIGALRSRLTQVLLVYLQNKHGAQAGVRHFADSLHFISSLFRLQQIQHSYFVYRHYVLNNAMPVPLFRDFLDPDLDPNHLTTERS